MQCIQIPETQEHPSFLVSLDKIGFEHDYDSELERAAQEEELQLPPYVRHSLQNTHTQLDSTPYIGSVTNKQAKYLNTFLGNFTLCVPYFKEFLLTLLQGINEESVYDENGNKIENIERLQATYDEVTKQIHPKRAEFLDATFQETDGRLHIVHNRFVDGQLQQVTEPLEDHLEEPKDTYFDRWLADSYFLPREGTEVEDSKLTRGMLHDQSIKDNVFTWFPPLRGCNVAVFESTSYSNSLGCSNRDTHWDPSIGVRAAKIL